MWRDYKDRRARTLLICEILTARLGLRCDGKRRRDGFVLTSQAAQPFDVQGLATDADLCSDHVGKAWTMSRSRFDQIPFPSSLSHHLVT